MHTTSVNKVVNDHMMIIVNKYALIHLKRTRQKEQTYNTLIQELIKKWNYEK